MSLKEDFYDYSDIEPKDFKGKMLLQAELDDIYNMTINVQAEWSKRENALYRLGGIALGNQSKSDTFVKFLNSRLSLNLGKQLADLRTSVMKLACRICSLCALQLGEQIESSMNNILNQYCLFKITGSANRVIADNSAICILNMVRYIHTVRTIGNVCEARSMKSNAVRIIAANCLLYIVGNYKTVLVSKMLGNIVDSLKALLVDANSEVRAVSRKAVLALKLRFPNEGNVLIETLEKNTKKQLYEDEKNIPLDELCVNFNVDNEERKVKKIIYDPSLNERKDEEKYIFNTKKTSGSIPKNKKNDVIDNFQEVYGNDDEDVDDNLNYNKYQTSKFPIKKTVSDEIKKNNLYTSKNIKKINQDEGAQKKNILKNLNSKLEKLELIAGPNPTNNLTVSVNNIQPKISNNNFAYNNNNINNVNSGNNSNKAKSMKVNNLTRSAVVVNNENNVYYDSNLKETEKKKTNLIEEKMLVLFNNLKGMSNVKDKLVVFQYLFNDFTEILKQQNIISKINIRKYVDIHIEHLAESDKYLVEQVIKNLMRMIYYMSNIFWENDIENIIKLLKIHQTSNDKTITILSRELLEIINQKF